MYARLRTGRRSRLAALMFAAMACGTPVWAAGADAPAAPSFAVVPPRPADNRSYKLALGTAIAGVVLVGVTFPLAAEADRRYDAYLAETDVEQIEARYQPTLQMDNDAKASLLLGEVLLATAVWMRFVHTPRESRVTTLESTERLRLDVRPDGCAIALRF